MHLPDLIGWSALALTVSVTLFRIGFRMGRDATLRYRETSDNKRQESAFCYRGLTYLLSDEPDRAIEEFIKAVRINSETVEIHLSLGNLYRARGEVGRAIRIHQNIIARPDLSVPNHTAALFALAEDYRQGGFLDRAVHAFRRVLEVDPNHRKTLAALQELHESERRWDLALEVLAQMDRVSGQKDPRRQAHLLLLHGLEENKKIEKSPQTSTDKSTGKSASRTAKKAAQMALKPYLEAIKVYPGCVEGYRLLGEAQLEAGESRAAIKNLQAVHKHRPSHFFLLINLLRQAYTQRNDERGFEKYMTEAVLTPHASARLMVSWSQILAEKHRVNEAIQVLQRGMVQHPASATLVRHLVLLLGRNQQADEALALADRYLDHLTSRQPVFQCSKCGFKSQDISWKCPQCRMWDTMEPIQ